MSSDLKLMSNFGDSYARDVAAIENASSCIKQK